LTPESSSARVRIVYNLANGSEREREEIQTPRYSRVEREGNGEEKKGRIERRSN